MNKNWGMNPTGVLRTRNVKSLYLDMHPLLNRREKELMMGGKAMAAQKVVDATLAKLQLRSGDGRPVTLADSSLKPYQRRVKAREGMGPVVETTTVKRGGASYQVPTPIHQSRRDARAVRWLVDGSRRRLSKDRVHGMADAMALETRHVLGDRERLKERDAESSSAAASRTSYGVSKMLMLHKNAKANRVFAHRRWH